MASRRGDEAVNTWDFSRGSHLVSKYVNPAVATTEIRYTARFRGDALRPMNTACKMLSSEANYAITEIVSSNLKLLNDCFLGDPDCSLNLSLGTSDKDGGGDTARVMVKLLSAPSGQDGPSFPSKKRSVS